MTLFTHHGRQRRLLIIAIVGCVVIAILSFVVGYFARSTGCDDGNGGKSPNSGAQSMSDKERNAMHQSIVDFMKTEELKKNMQWVIYWHGCFGFLRLWFIKYFIGNGLRKKHYFLPKNTTVRKSFLQLNCRYFLKEFDQDFHQIIINVIL